MAHKAANLGSPRLLTVPREPAPGDPAPGELQGPGEPEPGEPTAEATTPGEHLLPVQYLPTPLMAFVFTLVAFCLVMESDHLMDSLARTTGSKRRARKAASICRSSHTSKCDRSIEPFIRAVGSESRLMETAIESSSEGFIGNGTGNRLPVSPI